MADVLSARRNTHNLLQKWCPRQDSNPRPLAYKASTLPAELQGQNDYNVRSFSNRRIADLAYAGPQSYGRLSSMLNNTKRKYIQCEASWVETSYRGLWCLHSLRACDPAQFLTAGCMRPAMTIFARIRSCSLRTSAASLRTECKLMCCGRPGATPA